MITKGNHELAKVFGIQLEKLKNEKAFILKKQTHEAFLEYRNTMFQNWKNIPQWLSPGLPKWVQNLLNSEKKPLPTLPAESKVTK